MTLKDAQATLADEFVAELERLAGVSHSDGAGGTAGREDRAALARLKRCAGRSLADCPEVYPLFYRMLPSGQREAWEETLFLVATLFPYAPGRFTGDLGESMRRVAGGDEQRRASVDRRISVLLDSSREELPFRLRQAIHFLASSDVAIDWRSLLIDLLQWDYVGRPAQKRWARSYFSTGTEPAAGSEDTGE